MFTTVIPFCQLAVFLFNLTFLEGGGEWVGMMYLLKSRADFQLLAIELCTLLYLVNTVTI